MVTEAVAVHECASVTVTVYVPAARLLIAAVVELFDQLYVYPEVPPDPDAVAAPVLLP